MAKEKKENLLNDMLVINASHTWLRAELTKVRAAIAPFEENFFADLDSDEYRELRGKLKYLEGKCIFESKILAKFKKRVLA